MEAKQSDDTKSGNEARASILADAVMKIVEAYRITRSDIERYIAILQDESVITGFGSDEVICDIVEDPEVLESVAYLVHSEILSEVSKWWDRRVHEPRIEHQVLMDHLHTQYQTEKYPSYYIDYVRLRIMSGLSYEQQLNNRRTFYDVKKIFHLTKEELSEKLPKNEYESNSLIRGLIDLLTSPEEDEVRSIYKKLLLMDKKELTVFIENEPKYLKRDPIRRLAKLLYRL